MTPSPTRPGPHDDRWPALAPDLFQHTGALVYLVADDGAITHVNDAMAALLGGDPAACCTLDDLLAVLYPDPQRRQETAAAHARLQRSGGMPSEQERLVAARDGERRLVRWTLSRQEGPQGSFLAAVGFDLTSRWKLEQWVRLLAQCLGSVDEAVIVVDADGRIVHWGGAAETLFGGGATLRVERTLHDLFPGPDGALATEAFLADARRSERLDRVVDWVRIDGRPVRCQARTFPVRDLHGDHAATAILALPARPDTPEEEPTGARVMAAMDEAVGRTDLVAVVATDRDGRVRTWNRAAERLGGRAAGRAVGRLALSEVLQFEGLAWADLLATIGTRGRVQQRVQVNRPNGTVAPADLEAVAIRGPAGHDGYLLYLLDRSEEAGWSDEILAAKTAVLSSALLDGVVGRLETVLACLGPGAGPLARHTGDLRRVLHLLTEGRPAREIQATLRALDPARVDRELDALLYDLGEGVHRLRSLLDDARLVRDPTSEPARALDLGGMLASARTLLADRLAGCCRMRPTLGTLPPVRALPGPLLRTLLLLHLAAADSCQRSDREDAGMEVTGHVRDGWVRLELTEDGEGWGVDVLSRVGDLAWLAARPGLGALLLGLAHEEARAAGGTLEVEGAPGATSRYTLTLPAADALGTLPLPEPVPVGQRPGPVLLLEPDPLLRRALTRQLGLRFEVEAFASLHEALGPAGEGRYAAAVMGFQPPEGFGLQLAARLAEAHPSLFRNTVVLLPTGVRPATRERLAIRGAILLARTADPESLASVLDRLLVED